MSIFMAETGTEGLLSVIFDDVDLTVRFAIRSDEPISIPQMPWAFSIDGVMSSWRSFNFQPVTTWQNLGLAHVPGVEEVVLHLGNTNTDELGGPTDLVVDLLAHFGLVHIKIDSEYKLAQPFVKHNNEWKMAQPFAKHDNEWKTTI